MYKRPTMSKHHRLRLRDLSAAYCATCCSIMRSTTLVMSLVLFAGALASPLVPRALEMSPVLGAANPLTDIDKRQSTTATLVIYTGSACGGNSTSYALPGGSLSTCFATPQYRSAYVIAPSTEQFVVYPHLDCTGFGPLTTNTCWGINPFANGFSVEPLSRAIDHSEERGCLVLTDRLKPDFSELLSNSEVVLRCLVKSSLQEFDFCVQTRPSVQQRAADLYNAGFLPQ
ncbi:hypothetical protein DL93DRAFT_2159868 [Clavulina sp. PMI_390]|nr:hypothetical protein DL93DRAFT_2159868 [Clavulina sp. PMI_390]